MTQYSLSALTAIDGDMLGLYHWPLSDGVACRGAVLLVHGLGEHCGRYAHVAAYLNAQGFAVFGYDQYGHGESGGPRGTITSDARLLDDLADVLDGVQARIAPGTPIILLGHSLGGLVAARFVSLQLRPVQALVLSSPALDAGLSGFQKFLLSFMPNFFPNLQIGNGLKRDYISRDKGVVNAYKTDRMVHDRISPRLARFIAHAGPAILMSAGQWSVPTLLLYAGQDKLVRPDGSREFARLAPAAVVQSQCFDDLYHEIFNEPERVQVLAVMGQWLNRRFK